MAKTQLALHLLNKIFAVLAAESHLHLVSELITQNLLLKRCIFQLASIQSVC